MTFRIAVVQPMERLQLVASRIVAVGFRRANGQGSMGMAGVHADHRKPGSLQGMP